MLFREGVLDEFCWPLATVDRVEVPTAGFVSRRLSGIAPTLDVRSDLFDDQSGFPFCVCIQSSFSNEDSESFLAGVVEAVECDWLVEVEVEMEDIEDDELDL